MSKHSKNTVPAPAPESFHLPPSGVESHAHLNDRRYDQDREEVIRRAKTAGLARICQVFLSSQSWNEQKDWFLPHPEFFFLLGVHPTEAMQLTDGEFANLRAIASGEPRIRGIGEIGLDYYWKDCPPEIQQAAFTRQLHLARELKLPVVIHCRDAVEDTYALLLREGFQNSPVLWHCFNGDRGLAEKLLEAGWHLSIPGPVTFPANSALRDAVSIIPLERLMMETDCPYLTPMPHRGQRNEPAYLAFTIQAMAEAKNMSPAELWTSCGRTACRFFGLPLP